MTREEAIKILKAIRIYECYPKSASEETKEAIDMAIEALSNNITESPNEAIKRQNDAIDMVRCKDCRWWNGSQETMHNNHLCRNWSKFGSINTSAEDFCSYGERKGGAE